MAAGDVHGAVEGAGVVLVGLADVEHGGAVGDQRGRTRGVDLADLRLGGGEQISERGHALNPTGLVGIPAAATAVRRLQPTRDRTTGSDRRCAGSARQRRLRTATRRPPATDAVGVDDEQDELVDVGVVAVDHVLHLPS